MEERGEDDVKRLLNQFGARKRGTPGRRIALRRKYIFLRSVTAPTYQGREAVQGGNCQLTVINSLSQVAVIKPTISPSPGTGPNDPRSVSGQSNAEETRFDKFKAARLSIYIFQRPFKTAFSSIQFRTPARDVVNFIFRLNRFDAIQVVVRLLFLLQWTIFLIKFGNRIDKLSKKRICKFMVNRKVFENS